MTADIVDVAAVGLRRGHGALAGIDASPVDAGELGGCVFDERSHAWTLPSCRARIIVTDEIRYGRDHLAPYLGVASHGVPNYFMAAGADAVVGARLAYIAECLEVMRRTGSTRIEVLFSTQRVFNLNGAHKADTADASYWHRMTRLVPTAFDLSSHLSVVDDVYDGDATIRIADANLPVRVRLSGRLDPVDGRYHWQGTLFTTVPEETLTVARSATVSIGERTSPCRITERTQQGGYSVVGVGAPPYPLEAVDVVVPLR